MFRARLNFFLSVVDKNLKKTKLLAPPIHIQIENTNRCNLKCVICGRTHWDKTKNPIGDMDRETFNRIIPFLKNSPIITIQGMGEPFLSENIWWIIAECKKYDCPVVITTNGTLVNEEMARKMVLSGINKIFFSLDGLSYETFDSIRGIPSQIVLDGIYTLAKMKEELNSSTPEIAITFVAHCGNIAELPDLISRFSEIKLDKIEVRHLKVYSKTLFGKTLFDCQEKTREYFEKAKTSAQLYNINLVLPSLEEAKGQCRQPFELLFINWDGTVRACCSAAFHNPFSFTIGNLKENSIEELWNGAEIRRVRKGLLKGDPYPPCRNCAFNYNSSASHHRILDNEN